MKLYTGTAIDRLYGLDHVIKWSKDCSVLDVGCADGLVGYEFIKAGCRFIVGIEPNEKAYLFAQTLWNKTKAAFLLYNQKIDEILIEKYISFDFDIVLYLGVHHHFIKQYGEKKANAIAEMVMLKARRYFVFRTNHSVDLIELLEFNRFQFIEHYRGKGKVGALYVFGR